MTVGQIKSTTIFLLSPILGVLYAAFHAKENKGYSYILFALAMGCLGVLYPPVGDMYRYQLDYYFYKTLTFDEFVFELNSKFDFLLPALSFIFGKLGISFDIIRFLFNFISFFLLSIIFQNVIKISFSDINYKKIIIAFIIFIPLYISTFLFRFGFGTILFVYAVYLTRKGRNKLAYLFLVLSVIAHFSLSVFCLIYIFTKTRIISFKKKRTIFVFVIISFIVFQIFFNDLIFVLPTFIFDRYIVYFDGYWAQDFLEDHSLFYRLNRLIQNIINYGYLLIFLILYRKTEFLTNLIIGVSFITIIISPFDVVQLRFLIVLSMLIRFWFIIDFETILKKKKILYLLIFMSLTLDTMNLWSFRRQIEVGEYEKILYMPFPALLAQEYDKTWINQHVYENGNFKLN